MLGPSIFVTIFLLPAATLLPTVAAAGARRATDFRVDGAALPDVDFDVGESYAGLLPIGNNSSAGELFFWYFPSSDAQASDEITVWLNGGPGDSSLEGLLQENGPFIWQYGTWKPVRNPYSWANLTNMVWIEQPIGTGFSPGKPTAKSEQDIAMQFMGFWRHFVDTFDLHHRKVFLTGESYAGMYIPYLADAMFNANDTAYFGLEATMMYDPLINTNAVMRQVPALAFLDTWQNLLFLNESYTKQVRARASRCGYDGFLNHLQYPPSPIPPPPGDLDPDGACDIWGAIIDGATDVNPCFNVYHITDGCPLPWDVLGYPGSTQYLPAGAPAVYFNRTDVQNAIHAPHISWAEQSPDKVLNTSNGDSENFDRGKLPAITGLLPRVIERSKRTVIGHGGLDFILLMNGTLLSIQNMTWNGHQGFQTPITDAFVIPPHPNPDLATLAGAGTVGKTHSERGLTFFSVQNSGHMVPQYAPAAAYRSLEFLLGRIKSL